MNLNCLIFVCGRQHTAHCTLHTINCTCKLTCKCTYTFTFHTTQWTQHTPHQTLILPVAHLSLYTSNIQNKTLVALKIYMAKWNLKYSLSLQMIHTFYHDFCLKRSNDHMLFKICFAFLWHLACIGITSIRKCHKTKPFFLFHWQFLVIDTSSTIHTHWDIQCLPWAIFFSGKKCNQHFFREKKWQVVNFQRGGCKVHCRLTFLLVWNLS